MSEERILDVMKSVVDELKVVFDAMEDAAEKVLRYGRASGFLSALNIVLLGSSVVAVVVYLLIGGWYFGVAGGGLAAASLAAGRLSDRYYRKALEEFERLEKLTYTAALIIKLDETLKKTEKAVEELERELKKRGIVT
jgi:hypothetical protein